LFAKAQKFEFEYRKLKNESASKINTLIHELNIKNEIIKDFEDIINELKEDCNLFYQQECKNGAKLYKRNMDSGGQIVAFQNNKKITVKFNSI
jgi:hypothetical protein